MTALIAAVAENGVIGNKGRIPWRIKGELRRFRELTMGNVVVMGRRSYEEVGAPLDGRINIVVSNTKSFDGEGCLTARSLAEAIAMAGERDIFIAGGSRLFEEALPLAYKLYLTEIEGEFEGDTYFPAFDRRLFTKEIVERVEGEIPYTYVTYTRK